MQQVRGNRIFETSSGQETYWRGVGGAYNLHGASPQETLNAWEFTYIPLARYLGVNTIRLAFSLPYDPGDISNPYSVYLYDQVLMNAIVNLLAMYGIKSILDCHMYRMFYPYNTGSALSVLLLQSWINIANHFKNNENIVAYELFNEPQHTYGSTKYNHTSQETAQGYHDLTLAIRSVDPKHICIWQSPLTYGADNYIPSLDKIRTLLLPNVVYTYHVWHMLATIIAMGGADKASTTDLNALLNFRNANNVPIWVGEFGYESSYPNVDATWDYCQMLKVKCENNNIPWNLWMGSTNPAVPTMLQEYMAMFSKPPSGGGGHPISTGRYQISANAKRFGSLYPDRGT